MSGSSSAPEPPVLAFIEKTLADSYRKEIDQEENIWRTLPFFAATLALELTALFQVVEHLPTAAGPWRVVTQVALGLAMLCSLGALCFLASCIFRAKFLYVASDTALLDYALALMEDEGSPENEGRTVPLVALHVLKRNLARQYALATDNNRRINKRREGRRSVAGLLTIASVILTLGLVATTVAAYVPRHADAPDAARPSPPPATPQRPAEAGPAG